MSAIEKASKAIEDWFDFPDHKEVARAVLMAVREPGGDVARQVGRAAWHSGSGQRPENVWAAGIDAILSESDPK